MDDNFLTKERMASIRRIEEAVKALRNGLGILLIDDENREMKDI